MTTSHTGSTPVQQGAAGGIGRHLRRKVQSCAVKAMLDIGT